MVRAGLSTVGRARIQPHWSATTVARSSTYILIAPRVVISGTDSGDLARLTIRGALPTAYYLLRCSVRYRTFAAFATPSFRSLLGPTTYSTPWLVPASVQLPTTSTIIVDSRDLYRRFKTACSRTNHCSGTLQHDADIDTPCLRRRSVPRFMDSSCLTVSTTRACGLRPRCCPAFDSPLDTKQHSVGFFSTGCLPTPNVRDAYAFCLLSCRKQHFRATRTRPTFGWYIPSGERTLLAPLAQ